MKHRRSCDPDNLDNPPSKRRKIQSDTSQYNLDIIDLTANDPNCCSICYKEMKNKSIKLACKHEHCKDCLNRYVLAFLKRKEVSIACPTDKCNQTINRTDLKSILSKSDLQKFDELTVTQIRKQQYSNVSCCPTPNCGNSFVYKEGSRPYFYCTLCKKQYCLDCKCKYHHGITCDEYQKQHPDKESSRFTTGMKYKECSNCKRWIDWSLCLNSLFCICGNEFTCSEFDDKELLNITRKNKKSETVTKTNNGSADKNCYQEISSIKNTQEEYSYLLLTIAGELEELIDDDEKEIENLRTNVEYFLARCENTKPGSDGRLAAQEFFEEYLHNISKQYNFTF